MRDKAEAIQVKCPTCDHTQIIYAPMEEIPICPKCDIRMTISELLNEGKSY